MQSFFRRQAQRDQNAERTDDALLRAVAQKDVTAYEQFFDRHAQTVHSLVMRVVRDERVAEELVQEVFWQVWQRAEQYIGKGAPAAWLLRMARNRAIDQLRYQQARPRTVSEDQVLLNYLPAMTAPDIHDEVARSWQRNDIRQALGAIPTDQRVCLELAYFEGLSQREIAERTSTPLGTIKTRMAMGLQKLERTLRAAGYSESR